MGFQAPPPVAAKPTYVKDVKPTMIKFCFRCHTGPTSAGKVDLSKIQTDADAKKAIKVLKKSLKEIKQGAMPPKGNPKPADKQIRAFDAWVQKH